MKYKIVTYPDKSLRILSEEIKKFDKELRTLSDLLIFAMEKEDGVGVAAIQLGIPKRIIAVNTKDGPKIFVNPKILSLGGGKKSDIEGCLSVPRIFGKVERAKKIKFSAQDIFGKNIHFSSSGFFARVLQHEVDHTNGILFIDKASEIVAETKKSSFI